MKRFFGIIIPCLILCAAISAQVIPFAFEAGTPSTASAGPSVWYDTTAVNNGSFGTGGTFSDWVEVSIAQGGSATKLRFRCNISNNETVKVALFNSSSNLVAGVSGSIATTAADNGNLVDITGLSGTVTAGTYYIGLSASTGSGFRVGSQTGQAGRGNFALLAYAAFPPATLPAPGGQEGAIMQCGVWVQ
jgi:hypothetical protein